MPTIEYRRHARRDPGGVHLNAVGRAAAERVGRSSGAFDRAVTSPVPRAVETAEAMGATVAATVPGFAEMPADVERALGPIVEWSDYARAIDRVAAVRRFAHHQGRLLAEVARGASPRGRVLVVSHGGILELGALGAFPSARTGSWGGPARYLEGVRLEYEEGNCVAAELLRVDGPV